MSETILEVRHLSKSFGDHEVLRDIDFTVRPGDVTSIIGASGSGKSTLLRCVNLLETPTSGQILFHGQDVTGKGVNPSRYRSKVGMVFQSFNLFNNMTVLENCVVGQVKVPSPGRSPAARSSGWPSPGPWPWSRRYCSLTSPPPPWTRRWWGRCSPSCGIWPKTA